MTEWVQFQGMLELLSLALNYSRCPLVESQISVNQASFSAFLAPLAFPTFSVADGYNSHGGKMMQPRLWILDAFTVPWKLPLVCLRGEDSAYYHPLFMNL